MLSLPKSVKIYVASTAVDMRMGHDGLFAVVREQWKKDPFTGHLFVFFGRAQKLVTLCIPRSESGQPECPGVLKFCEVARSPFNNLPYAYPDGLGVECAERDLPGRRRHGLLRG